MHDHPLAQIRSELVEGVAIIDLLPHELTEPEESARLGAALARSSTRTSRTACCWT